MAYEMKTKATEVEPTDYIAGLDHKTRKADSKILLDMLSEITGLKPRMWGPTMIGYGAYDYTYDSGHSGRAMMTGFAPRKANMVLYVMPGYKDMAEPLSRLGKHKMGKACLYINKLADVDLDVLREIVTDGYNEMIARYGPSKTD